MGPSDGEQDFGFWIDKAGDVSHLLVRFLAAFFVLEGAIDNGDRARAREIQFVNFQRRDFNRAMFYSAMSKLRSITLRRPAFLRGVFDNCFSEIFLIVLDRQEVMGVFFIMVLANFF